MWFNQTMPFDLENIKRYIKECNISLKGVLHVGSKSDTIQILYNSINIHNNNIIWVESDKIKAEKNLAIGLPNCFTTVIDSPEKVTTYKYVLPTHCIEICCNTSPQLIITEGENSETLSLQEFMDKNNFDPAEYNFWNFDSMGSEFRIFKGSQHLLKFADIIYTGVNSTEITKKSNRNSEIDTLLGQHGLRRVETIKNEDNWCMALYIRI
jgi:hypothetical protein